jgi:aromatic-L-amino-acid decarboxylase
MTTLDRPTGTLTAEQETGLTDMDPETFRRAAHKVVDLMADYLAAVESLPVLRSITPG